MEYPDDLYIQIVDGQPHEHPIFANNFKDAFPDIDTENLPSNFAKFIRVKQPEIGLFEVLEPVTYQWFDNVVKDVWTYRPMTDQEKRDFIAQVKSEAIKRFDSWVWSDEELRYLAPVIRPNDGKNYVWSESNLNWILQ
jgi:hypothetical protein